MPRSFRKKKVNPSIAEIARIIDTSVVDDYPDRPRYRKRGRRTKMGICGFLYSLYVINEQLAIKGGQHPMTNASIEREFFKEFGHLPEVAKSWEKGYSSVNSFRHKYNKGRLLENSPHPELISLRYDKHGNVVCTRTGKRKLTPAECRDLCFKYEIPDSRFCSPADQELIRSKRVVAHAETV